MKNFSHLRELQFLSLTFGLSLCSVVKLPKSLETLLLHKYCFLFGIAVIDIHFENDNIMPKLSKVLNDNCIARFYHELDPDCYIKVRQR